MSDISNLSDSSYAQTWANLYAFVATHLPQVLEPLNKKRDNRRYLESIPGLIKDSIGRQLLQVSRFTNVVFGAETKSLADYYIPMQLIGEANKNTIKIGNDWDLDFIPRYKKVLIKDTAGMGKSTLLKWLLLISHPSKKIPIYIELRNTSKENSLYDQIAKKLGNSDIEITREVLDEMLKNGSFLFLFDGFDEVALSETKEVVMQLSEIATEWPENFMVISSREEKALQSLIGFSVFTIAGLTYDEAETLIRRLDESIGIAENLIELLKQDKYESIRDFLKNPLLVSYLFKTFQYKAKIPLKKSVFYSQVYQALFESHDLRKGSNFEHEKHCRLTIDGFEKIIRLVALSGAKLGSIGFERERWIKLIDEAKNFHPSLKFEANQFLQDLITTVPLCMNDGTNIRWAHKALQDYFSASFICYDSAEHKNDIFQSILHKRLVDRFYNVLEICRDIDEGIFDLGFTKPLFTELLDQKELVELPANIGQLEQLFLNVEIQSNVCLGVFTEEFLSEVHAKYLEEIEPEFSKFGKSRQMDDSGMMALLEKYRPHTKSTRITMNSASKGYTFVILSKSNPINYGLKLYFDAYYEVRTRFKRSLVVPTLLTKELEGISYDPFKSHPNVLFNLNEFFGASSFDDEYKSDVLQMLIKRIPPIYNVDFEEVGEKLKMIKELSATRDCSNFI